MPSDIIIVALIGAGGSVTAAALSLAGILISLANRSAIAVVKTQTDGMLEKMTSAAAAKGVEVGHAAGVEAGAKAVIEAVVDKGLKEAIKTSNGNGV